MTFLSALIANDLLFDTRSYLDSNEQRIISKYSDDTRRLVTESINGRCLIKYFELPFAENPQLFGRYINSNIFRKVSEIMKEDLHLVSVEVHSRNPGGSHIPLHQDNAYYGLEGANACTLFVPLLVSDMGNLRYIANPADTFYEHERSNAEAFSLQVSRKQHKKNEFVGREVIYKHQLGGAFLHHSNSLHFANNVPSKATRVWAVRLTFFGSSAALKQGHSEWYNKVVLENRSNARL